MLIRATEDGTFECIAQEHHALLSGVLAGAWMPTSIDSTLVQAIGLHDNPWRSADREPLFDAETGLPNDFVDYPMEAKIELYREGIDELEAVHPWVAYLVSRHYTTFAGTRDETRLTEPEAERRRRLEERVARADLEASDEALAWMKYFDVLSLYLGLAGPAAVEASIPPWLSEPSDWAEAPDGTPLELEWADDSTVELAPWPFSSGALGFELEFRRLEGRFDDEESFRDAWAEAEWGRRAVKFEAQP